MDDERGREEVTQRDRIRYQVMLESIFKFRLFWAGLLFAVLSFALQFPAKSKALSIKVPEAAAWVLLFITAIFAIKDCGGWAGKITESVAEGLPARQRTLMWGLFLAATLLLLAARILDAFGVQSEGAPARAATRRGLAHHSEPGGGADIVSKVRRVAGWILVAIGAYRVTVVPLARYVNGQPLGLLELFGTLLGALFALGLGYYLLTGWTQRLRMILGWVLLGYGALLGMILLWYLVGDVVAAPPTEGLVLHIVLMVVSLVGGYFLLRRRSMEEGVTR